MTKPWMAALGAAALVGPWVVVALASGGELSAARAAIPSQGDSIDAAVAPSFASAPYFLLVDLDTLSVEAVENTHAEVPGVLGLKAASALLRAGAGVVLARSIGPAPRNLLFTRGAQVYLTQGRTGREALGELASGTATKLGPPSPPTLASPGPPPLECPPVACAPAVPAVETGPVTARSSGALGSPPAPAALVPAVEPAPARPITVVAPTAPGPTATLDLQLTTVAGVGAQVVAVQRGSRAQWAGFQPGDIIVKLGQTVVRSAEQLQQLWPQVPADQNAMVRVLRHNGAVERLLIVSGGQATLGDGVIQR